MLKARRWSVLLLNLVFIAACSARPAAEPPPATPVEPVVSASMTPVESVVSASATLVEPVVAAIATPAPDPTALCPAEREGTTRYVSTENGLCFLYPSNLALDADQFRPDAVVHLMGSLADPNAMETMRLKLSVAYNGPADGLDSSQYAQTWINLNAPGMELQQESTTIGGQPAVIVHELPDMMSQRGAFLVANGVKYQILLQPRPEDTPQLAEEGTSAWETVIGSIVFFPAQNTRSVVRPEDVCPAETEGSKLLVSLVGGYCLLHPADFAPDPAFPVAIVGGAELGPVEGFDTLRASLAVGNYDLGDQPREQALRPLSDQIDPNSVMTTTISGYPAVVYDFTGGPWRQRNAQILVGNLVYTFVGQPWDTEKFPQALPDVERLWNMANASIAFFDKWR